MSIIVVIPARYESTRFPGKPLAKILGKPMIEWVYKGACCFSEINEAYVATDDERIIDCVKGFGGKALLTSKDHSCGTDRVAECVNMLKLNDDDIVVNVQGDEPLTDEILIEDLVKLFSDEKVSMATLKHPISSHDDTNNPNIVKVETDFNDWALTFSRSPIPYFRNSSDDYRPFKHIGIYGYRVGFLKKFVSLPKGRIENAESLEQMRALENGYSIKVGTTSRFTFGVDAPDQIRIVESILLERFAKESQ